MPSIVYRSPSITAQRLALVSQNLTEQANGLVEVNVEYCTVVSDRARVLPLFKTDAPPPIIPDIVNLDALQTRRLYLRNFSTAQANGMLTISASYVGANFTALQSPAIYSDFADFFILLETVSVSATQNISNDDGGTSSVQTNYEDYYAITCNFRIEEQQAAVIGRQNISLGAPSVFTTENREGLIMGAIFRYRFINPFDPSIYNTKLSGIRFQSMTAIEIINDVMSQKGVIKTQKIDHITPTVKLLSDVYTVDVGGDRSGDGGAWII